MENLDSSPNNDKRPGTSPTPRIGDYSQTARFGNGSPDFYEPRIARMKRISRMDSLPIRVIRAIRGLIPLFGKSDPWRHNPSAVTSGIGERQYANQQSVGHSA
jgi:hypothetical protein